MLVLGPMIVGKPKLLVADELPPWPGAAHDEAGLREPGTSSEGAGRSSPSSSSPPKSLELDDHCVIRQPGRVTRKDRAEDANGAVLIRHLGAGPDER
jgi:hypothetical protein